LETRWLSLHHRPLEKKFRAAIVTALVAPQWAPETGFDSLLAAVGL
jgi:hypothetical protein